MIVTGSVLDPGSVRQIAPVSPCLQPQGWAMPWGPAPQTALDKHPENGEDQEPGPESCTTPQPEPLCT